MSGSKGQQSPSFQQQPQLSPLAPTTPAIDMQESVLHSHYVALNKYLSRDAQNSNSRFGTGLIQRSASGSARVNKAREKLLRLSKAQFTELSTDVHDELRRRSNDTIQSNVSDSLGTTDSSHLTARDTFHPKRNQARQKLSTLPNSRFKDLATDILYEIERRYSNFALDKPQNDKTITSSLIANPKSNSPTQAQTLAHNNSVTAAEDNNDREESNGLAYRNRNDSMLSIGDTTVIEDGTPTPLTHSYASPVLPDGTTFSPRMNRSPNLESNEQFSSVGNKPEHNNGTSTRRSIPLLGINMGEPVITTPLTSPAATNAVSSIPPSNNELSMNSNKPLPSPVNNVMKSFKTTTLIPIKSTLVESGDEDDESDIEYEDFNDHDIVDKSVNAAEVKETMPQFNSSPAPHPTDRLSFAAISRGMYSDDTPKMTSQPENQQERESFKQEIGNPYNTAKAVVADHVNFNNNNNSNNNNNENTYNAFQIEYEDLSALYKELKDDLNAKDLQIEELNNGNTQMTEKLQSLELQLLQAESLKENAEIQNGQLMDTLQELEMEKMSNQKDYLMLKSQHEELSQQHQQQLDQLSRSMNDQVESLKSELQTHVSTISELRGNLDSREIDLKEAPSVDDHVLMQSRLALVNSEHEELDSNYKLLNTAHEELKLSHEELKSAHDKLSGEYELLQLNHDELKSNNNELKLTHQELASTHDQLQSSHAELLTNYDKLNASHQEIQSTREIQANQEDVLPISESVTEPAIPDVSVISRENKSLKTELETLNIKYTKLHSQFENFLRSKQSAVVSQNTSAEPPTKVSPQRKSSDVSAECLDAEPTPHDVVEADASRGVSESESTKEAAIPEQSGSIVSGVEDETYTDEPVKNTEISEITTLKQELEELRERTKDLIRPDELAIVKNQLSLVTEAHGNLRKEYIGYIHPSKFEMMQEELKNLREIIDGNPELSTKANIQSRRNPTRSVSENTPLSLIVGNNNPPIPPTISPGSSFNASSPISLGFAPFRTKTTKLSHLSNDYNLLKANYEKLQAELVLQQKVTDKVRAEASLFLNEMRAMADKETGSNEALSQQVHDLQVEIQEWRSRYSKVKSQVRNIRASTYGAGIVQPTLPVESNNEYIDKAGRVRDICVTKFQVAMDEFLLKSRTAEKHELLEFLHNVVICTREITQDVNDNDDSDSSNTPHRYSDLSATQSRIAEQTSVVSSTANALITSTRNHVTSSGLMPLYLLDAAASDLSSSVIDLIKIAKIRLTFSKDFSHRSSTVIYGLPKPEDSVISKSSIYHTPGNGDTGNIPTGPAVAEVAHSQFNNLREEMNFNPGLNDSPTSKPIQVSPWFGNQPNMNGGDQSQRNPMTSDLSEHDNHSEALNKFVDNSLQSHNLINVQSQNIENNSPNLQMNFNTSQELLPERSKIPNADITNEVPPRTQTQSPYLDDARSDNSYATPTEGRIGISSRQSPVKLSEGVVHRSVDTVDEPSNAPGSSDRPVSSGDLAFHMLSQFKPSDNTLTELQEYLENQTVYVIESIQSLLTSIKDNSVMGIIEKDALRIIKVVDSMVDATSVSMGQSRHAVLKEHGSWILNDLKNCAQRMGNMFNSKQMLAVDPQSYSDKHFKQRLAGISFDMAKCTKELVKTIEEVSLKSELVHLDKELDE